ncbi:hypothetical protein QCE49_24175 [Caballeronia sp. LZ008]|uniref:hypothetical protein n=1 Tax=unclassified Caballeronia TaxID=2646786 RepID=UPI002028919C|nr:MULTISPECIES: hypothetical protein [unclassified Caballeronia]MDR5796486.1 hypothetical protein [Caballeronia sp. LZ008]
MKIIEQLWTFALDNPVLLIAPAISFVLSVVAVRVQTRYVNEGVLFCWKPGARRESKMRNAAEEGELSAESHIDLTVALKTIHEIAVAEGDLGHEYWYTVGKLLKRANGMQAEIDFLSKELERCHAMLDKAK